MSVIASQKGTKSTKIRSNSIITKEQIKAGRALLGWSQHDLSEFSSVSLNTIKRIESGDDKINARFQTIEKIIETFSEHNLTFQNDTNKLVITLTTGNK
jgi:predicted transcriptional regulator